MVKGALRSSSLIMGKPWVLAGRTTYWGAYNNWYADVCEEFIALWLARTTDKAFDDEKLMNSYADKAIEVSNRGGIVSAHSMANAILAVACWKKQKCVQWYSLGGGYSGQAIGPAVLDLMSPTKNIIEIQGAGPNGASLPIGLKRRDAIRMPCLLSLMAFAMTSMACDLPTTRGTRWQSLSIQKIFLKAQSVGFHQTAMVRASISISLPPMRDRKSVV